MDGLSFKCSTNLMEEYFSQDSYGSFIPDKSKLQMEVVRRKLAKQLSTDTGFYSRLANIYERTDVQFTDNPLGNTPTLGVGLKLFGKRPLNVKRGERLERIKGRGQKLSNVLQNRENKIESIHNELAGIYAGIESNLSSDAENLLYKVEGDQLMTGGGFDNNHVGGVHESALHFIVNSSSKIDYADTELSQIVVDACNWLRDYLEQSGLVKGSIKPLGASVVRAAQDNDGLFGYPVMDQGYSEWTQDYAQRMLIESGVDTSHLVGSTVHDKALGATRKFAVLDAGAYILDNKVFSANDMVSLVLLLARIQKHGWKMENGELHAKDGKTRSVYPNAFLPALIESMIIDPFNRKLKELKITMLPSLQDKPTRVEIIRKQIVDAFNNDYDYLAADWSKYDSSVKGCILATIMQLVVKPFINSQYYYWIDAATYILCYKYLILDTNLASINQDAFKEALNAAPNFTVRNYTVFGLVDGLISGAKFTHVGGSLYGEVTIHYGIGRLLGWTPIIGAQAGDDTLMGVPKSHIDISSVSNTYDPISKAAERFGLQMNVSKQIWHQAKGEVVKVFLQDSYHYGTDVWGVGSIFRPADAVWVSERDKGLSVAEQLMAEIARMNGGADSPFVKPVVEWWLSHERYLGWTFKEYGVSGFSKIVESIGESVDDIVKNIDVGSFTFGVDRKDVEAGTLPILPIMAEVAHEMTFSSEDKADFLKDLAPQDESGEVAKLTDIALDESDE